MRQELPKFEEIEKEANLEPSEELKGVLKLRREERPAALERFKEKLAQQKEAIADFQEDLIDEIQNNPDLPIQELLEEVERVGDQHDLSTKQRTFATAALLKYDGKRKAVSEYREKYPDDQALYEAVFDREPKGIVEVVRGPMTLYFRCYSPEDYAFIHQQAFFTGEEILAKDIAVANASGGVSVALAPKPGLGGTIIAENVATTRPQQSETTRIHEEQHAMKKLFNHEFKEEQVLDDLPRAETNEEAELILTRRFRELRRDAEDDAKDEMLAYLKSESGKVDVYSKLTQTTREGGLYDYLEELKNHKSYKELAEMAKVSKDLNSLMYYGVLPKVAKEVFEKEYNDLIEQGISAFLTLKNALGYSSEKAAALLIHEPLSNWAKTAKRMYEASQNKK